MMKGAHLLVIAGLVLIASSALGQDTDGDGVNDPNDNCPTVPNSDQADNDPNHVANDPNSGSSADGVGDACDNCRYWHNPRQASGYLSGTTPHQWATLSGGQRDDDADGYGNMCDAQFPGHTGLPNVATQDLTQFRASNGHPKAVDNCGTLGTRPCAIFDLNENVVGVPNIDSGDLTQFRELDGLIPGPKCATCPQYCAAGTAGDCNGVTSPSGLGPLTFYDPIFATVTEDPNSNHVLASGAYVADQSYTGYHGDGNDANLECYGSGCTIKRIRADVRDDVIRHHEGALVVQDVYVRCWGVESAFDHADAIQGTGTDSGSVTITRMTVDGTDPDSGGDFGGCFFVQYSDVSEISFVTLNSILSINATFALHTDGEQTIDFFADHFCFVGEFENQNRFNMTTSGGGTFNVTHWEDVYKDCEIVNGVVEPGTPIDCVDAFAEVEGGTVDCPP